MLVQKKLDFIRNLVFDKKSDTKYCIIIVCSGIIIFN